ncbi:hypothetical protein P3T18_001430 [Paraburkholderia sp. GAS199]|uniref:DUF2486 family protein n=1 Tax=Paraburkholderia sp. GAS199 TaxID=3035126 RepID=UPI003D1C8221
MSDPHDNSIPVLHEILVPGNAAQARQPAQPGDSDAAPVHGAGPLAESTEPVFAPAPSQSPEPFLAAEPLPAQVETVSPSTPAHTPPAHAGEHGHAKKRARPHAHAEPRHAHEQVQHAELATSAGVFDRAEPAAPPEAGAIVPPDIEYEAQAHAHADLDADVIAERLRGRFAGFLTGEGRGIVEARCREALQEHSAWLVNQITREVALALETEMTGWVREAVAEEIARRAGH